jgi:hypothetical protein
VAFHQGFSRVAARAIRGRFSVSSAKCAFVFFNLLPVMGLQLFSPGRQNFLDTLSGV